MILNSDVTASQKLGVANTVTPLDNLKLYWDKAIAWKPSTTTFAMIVGGCVILIIEKKLRLKPKKINLSYGGKK